MQLAAQWHAAARAVITLGRLRQQRQPIAADDLTLQRKRNSLSLMKSAIIPQVRVEPALRDELEAVLQAGETLSEFVEASLRNAVAFRRVQSHLLARGQAAWEHYKSTGMSVPAVEVVAKLQAKLDTRRKQLAR
jgi:hypothetical protein